MDLRGEEGESCIAAEESRCNRLTRLSKVSLCKNWDLNSGESVWYSGWEGRKRGRRRGEEGTEALVINLCRGGEDVHP